MKVDYSQFIGKQFGGLQNRAGRLRFKMNNSQEVTYE